MKYFSILAVVLSLIFVISPNLFADEGQSAEAEVFVKDISAKILGIMNNEETPDAQKEEQLRNFFVKYVNTKWMAKFVLGRFGHSASEEQLLQYTNLYHDYLVYSYVPKFRDYKGTELNILRVSNLDNGESIVQTEVVSKKDQPNIRVDYRIRKDDDGVYKVVDLVGEGISLITTQRSDFGGLISRKGLDFFIRKLDSKVNKLKAPADTTTAASAS